MTELLSFTIDGVTYSARTFAQALLAHERATNHQLRGKIMDSIRNRIDEGGEDFYVQLGVKLGCDTDTAKKLTYATMYGRGNLGAIFNGGY